MTTPPRVFISATSADLRTVRQLVKDALLTIDCHPVEQTTFAPDYRTVEQMLRDKVADCQALIHIAGLRYGAEPDPASLPPGTPRRSFTQMEYALGRDLQATRGEEAFRVYTFVCPEAFPYDVPKDEEDQTKRALQQAHRAALLGEAHLYDVPATDADLRARVLAIQEQVLLLRREQAAVTHVVRSSRRTVLAVLGVVVLLLAGVLAGQWWLKERQRHDADRATAAQQDLNAGQREIATALVDGQKITTAGIRKQILLGSERKRDRDLAEAGQAAGSIEQEKLRKAAQDAHSTRISRIDELATSFAEIEGRADATAVSRELVRILGREGIDLAIAYAAEQRPGILERVKRRKAAEQQQTRTELRPLLGAAELKETAGQPAAARAAYRELLALDPAWPAALETYGDFLLDQATQSHTHGTLTAAVADAEELHALAARLVASDPASPIAQRLLSSSHNRMGDVLRTRGEAGDAERALAHYTRGLQISDKLLAQNPASPQAARDVSVSLERLGDFLAVRGGPGEAEQALVHYTRSNDLLENLLAKNPDSDHAARDVSVSLGRLASVLAARGGAGDADRALAYYTRELEISQKLLAQSPASAQAARDVLVVLKRLGDFLAARGRAGDADRALAYYTRDLEISVNLLAQNPGSALAARDASVILDCLGGFLTARGSAGDAEKALAYFTRGLDVRETLLAQNPASAEAARDVSISLNKLGGFLAARAQPGDAERALAHFTRSNTLLENLRARNPDSAQAARDVCVSLDRLGDFAARGGAAGDVERALAYYTRSLDVRETLLARNPDSARAAKDVSTSLNKLGVLLAARGQPGDAERALAHFTRSLEVDEQLLARNPDSARAARDVSICLDRLGGFLAARGRAGDAGQALACFTRGLDLREKVLAQNPASADAARELGVSHYQLAAFATQRGDAAGEAKHSRALYDLLKPRIEKGTTFDPQTLRIYGELKTRFTTP